MIALLSRLANFMTPTTGVMAQLVEEMTAPGKIGFTVLAIIVVPVTILTITSILGKPRTMRVPVLFFGSVILLVGTLIAGFALSSVLLKFIVPQ